MTPEVNFLAVLACGVVSMVIGSLWYGPLFGKPWMAMTGIKKPDVITPEIKKSMAKSYSLMFVGSLVMAFILSHILEFASVYTKTYGITAGVVCGLWTWLGFVAPATIGSVLWDGKPWKLWFINAGFFLIQLPVFGVILALWK